MSWNYRVMAWEQEKELKLDNPYLQIHSVYYKKDGTPKAFSERGHEVGGDSLKDVKDDIKQMKLALNKPIIWVGDKFPKEYKP